jgi:hypothetical protein
MVNIEIGFNLSNKGLYTSLFPIEWFRFRYLIYRVLRFGILKFRDFLLKFQDNLGHLLFSIGSGTITRYSYCSGVLR